MTRNLRGVMPCDRRSITPHWRFAWRGGHRGDQGRTTGQSREDPVSALLAVTRPIINGVAHSIGGEYLDAYDRGRTAVPLRMIGRLRKEGDGDIGIAFEYAIHEAVQRENAIVLERVTDALKFCNIKNGDPASIRFAIEKQGSKQLISTDLDLITDNSRALSGKQGQPVKLKKYLNQLAAAFRRPKTGPNLPQSIKGRWKADLFLGSPARRGGAHFASSRSGGLCT